MRLARKVLTGPSAKRIVDTLTASALNEPAAMSAALSNKEENHEFWEEKSRWLPVQAAVLAVLSLKRSSPVARRSYRYCDQRKRRAGDQRLFRHSKGLMSRPTRHIESVLENVRAEFGKWIS